MILTSTWAERSDCVDGTYYWSIYWRAPREDRGKVGRTSTVGYVRRDDHGALWKTMVFDHHKNADGSGTSDLTDGPECLTLDMAKAWVEAEFAMRGFQVRK